MEYIEEDIKYENWDHMKKPIPIIKVYININSNNTIYFSIYVIPNKIINNFDLSILNLICNPNKKASLFEIPFCDNITYNKPDIIIGFIPHPDASDNDNINVTILLEPQIKSIINKFIKKYQCIEWNCQIKHKNIQKITPFLYGYFPFPAISYINWNIKLSCKSHLKPSILCANVQTFERNELIMANIYIPIKTYLFPNLNKYKSDNKFNDIILKHM